MTRVLLSCLAVVFYGAAGLSAHHTVPGRSHPTVTIAQSVMADGKPLAPGKYEIWITDQRPTTGAGAPSEGQRVVEFAQNGKVVARDHGSTAPIAAATKTASPVAPTQPCFDAKPIRNTAANTSRRPLHG